MKDHDKKHKSKTNKEKPLSDNNEANNQSPSEVVEQGNDTSELNNLQKEILQLNEKISEIERSNADLKDLLLRKAAEFENYKRRTENDQLNLIKYAAEPFIKSILPVYDNLEKSITHLKENNNFESLRKGVELVYENFTKILESQGVKKIQAKGKPFDVELHDALLQQPVAGIPAHTILEVVEDGYTYKDKVLRHSKVIVSTEAEDQKEIDNNEKTNNPNE